MQRTYKCNEHGLFEISQSIHEDVLPTVDCPICGLKSPRSFKSDLPPSPHYHCQGFHATDYSSTGDKLEELNRNWSKHFGAPPPPPAKIDRNSSEPQ